MKIQDRVGEILTKYGGTKYKNVALDDMKTDVVETLKTIREDYKSMPQYMMLTSLIKKVNKSSSTVVLLTHVTETQFSLMGG